MSDHDNVLRAFKLGQTVLPAPTGRWTQDADGYWRELFSDGYTIEPDVSITDVWSYEAPIRLSDPPWRWVTHQRVSIIDWLWGLFR